MVAKLNIGKNSTLVFEPASRPPVIVGPEISGTDEPTAHRRCRPHTLRLEVEKRRENRVHTHSTGRSSVEEMTKLNSLTLLNCSGKLYIQLYPSNPNTQTCQAIMLLQ